MAVVLTDGLSLSLNKIFPLGPLGQDLIYAQIMYSDWAVFVEDNDNNRGQKYPSWERTACNPGSINLFITIRDYDHHEEKGTRPIY